MEQKVKKASDIYKVQNRLIHKAMAAAGFSYNEDKVLWLKLMSDVAKRPVGGLSEMSLGERHKLIAYFQGRGQRIFAPAVPAKIRDWKKGDADIEYGFREEDDPQIRMVFVIWTEMGYRPKTLYGLCYKLFKKNHPRWLDDRQLSHLVNVVQQTARRKGLGNYYRRTA